MRSSIAPEILIGLTMLAAMALTFTFMPKQFKKPLREYRRQQRKWSLLVLPAFGLNLWVAISQQNIFLVALWLVALGAWALPFLSIETLAREKEARINYALDPAHCGRCEYDLSGTSSGVCSECGWELPMLPIRLQSPRWHVWWRGWRIEYLHDPKQTRLVTSIAAFTCLLLAAVMLLLRVTPVAVMALGAGLHLAVNVLRVHFYLRSQ